MTIYFLDTCIVLYLLRDGEVGRAIAAAYGLGNATARAMISTVTVGELESFAIHRGWGDTKRDELRTVLESLTVVDIGHPSVVRAYGEFDAFSISAGREMGKNDVWIAATAAVTGTTLLTSDKDFVHLIGTKVTGILLDARTGMPV